MYESLCTLAKSYACRRGLRRNAFRRSGNSDVQKRLYTTMDKDKEILLVAMADSLHDYLMLSNCYKTKCIRGNKLSRVGDCLVHFKYLMPVLLLLWQAWIG